MSKRILVIPDSQIRPNDSYDFLTFIGKYAVDIQPDIIVHLGDFADMPSLSSHDKAGSKSMEGQRYKADIKATHEAMQALLAPIKARQDFLKKNHKPRWKPRMVMLYGNHEYRMIQNLMDLSRLTICIIKRWAGRLYLFFSLLILKVFLFATTLLVGLWVALAVLLEQSLLSIIKVVLQGINKVETLRTLNEQTAQK